MDNMITPTNTNGNRRTKKSVMTSSEPNKAKTQLPKDPGAFNNDQTNLSQPI